jgi:hypothetical protein
MNSMREKLSCLINGLSSIRLMVFIWIRTFSAENKHSLVIWKPQRIIYMIQLKGFDDWSGRVCPSKVCLWPETIENRMIYFWLSNFLKSIGFEICWRLNSRSKSSESPSTYWVSVRVEFVKNMISLSQRQYIEEIVRSFSFHKGNKL